LDIKSPAFQIILNRPGGGYADTGELASWENSIGSCITSFCLEDKETALDICEFMIANDYGLHTDGPWFGKDNYIVARWGYADDPGGWQERTMMIKSLDVDYPESGYPTIKVTATDLSASMTEVVVTKMWKKESPGYTYADIAREIAGKYGLEPKVMDTIGTHSYIAQDNKSDMNFLIELADKAKYEGGAGFACYVENRELHFHKRDKEMAPIMSLTYATDKSGMLKSFKPQTIEYHGSPSAKQITAIGIDPRTKEVVEDKSKSSTSDVTFIDGESGKIVDNPSASETNIVPPASTTGKDKADADLDSMSIRVITATATTIGTPLLHAKANIEILGVGLFSRIYYIEHVRHTINDSGYTCELELRSDPSMMGGGAGGGGTDGKKPDMTVIDAE